MASKRLAKDKDENGIEAPGGGTPGGDRNGHGTVDGMVVGFAEDLGALLGSAQNKAESWIGQRGAVVKQLEAIRDTATALLGQLGQTTGIDVVDRVRRRRRPKKFTPPDSNPAGALKPEKRRTKGISAAGRAAISAAQKARWAAYKNKRVPK